MPTRTLDFPVFDADNHMYETPTPSPSSCPGVRRPHPVRQVNGRTKIAVKGTDQRVHPQSHLRGGGRARCPGGVLQDREPRGQVPAGDHGQAHPGAARLQRARTPPQADGRARPRPCPHVADAGQPARGAPARRPAGHPRRGARPQPVDARALDLQLREPDLPHPGHPPGHRGQGHRGARVGARAGGQDHPHPAGPGLRIHGPPLARPSPSSTRSGSWWPRPASRWGCTPRTAATSATSTNGRECSATR